VLAAARERLLASYPAAVVHRFFQLELLDRAFGLAAQGFVALLPLVIVVVVTVTGGDSAPVAQQIGDRFDLDQPTRTALQLLFEAPSGVRTVSWLAVIMCLLSAFSLSRRLSRVYSLIIGVPSLARGEVWRGLVWILVQVAMFLLASGLRGVRRDSGAVLATVALVLIVAVWFLGDVASLRLLVPSISRVVLVSTAIVSGIGRVGLGLWSAIYMPKALSSQAEQYGPIGVTFSIFSYILAAVFVYLCAPLLVVVWQSWRAGRREAALAVE
jgi:membrane protein